MLAQRGGTKLDGPQGGAKAETARSARRRRNRAAAPKAPRKKLSFKQKFALENLPKKMEAVIGLDLGAGEPASPTRPSTSAIPASFQKTIAALDKERATLATMEEEWLELEMLREEMEG